ncbi:MAG: hypothetical protein ACTSU5_11865 [Promethearchaeota archaeon]
METIVEEEEPIFLKVGPIKLFAACMGVLLLAIGFYARTAGIILAGVALICSTTADKTYSYSVIGLSVMYIFFRTAFSFLYESSGPLSYGFSIFSYSVVKDRIWLGHAILIISVSIMYVSFRHGYKRAGGKESDYEALSIIMFLASAIIVATWYQQLILEDVTVPSGVSELGFKTAVWVEHFALVCFVYSIAYSIFIFIGAGIQVTGVRIRRAISVTYRPGRSGVKIAAITAPISRGKKKKLLVLVPLIVLAVVLPFFVGTITGSFLKPGRPFHGTGHAVIQLYDKDTGEELTDWEVMLFNYDTEEYVGTVDAFSPIILTNDTLAVPKEKGAGGWPSTKYHPATVALEGNDDPNKPAYNQIYLKRKAPNVYFRLYDLDTADLISNDESFDHLIGTQDEVHVFQEILDSKGTNGQLLELSSRWVTNVTSFLFCFNSTSNISLTRVDSAPGYSEYAFYHRNHIQVGGVLPATVYDTAAPYEPVQNYFNITYENHNTSVLLAASTCQGFDCETNSPTVIGWFGAEAYIPYALLDPAQLGYISAPIANATNTTDYTGWAYFRGATVEVFDESRNSEVLTVTTDVGGENYTFVPFGQARNLFSRKWTLYTMWGNITEIGLFSGLIDNYVTAGSDTCSVKWHGIYGG